MLYEKTHSVLIGKYLRLKIIVFPALLLSLACSDHNDHPKTRREQAQPIEAIDPCKSRKHLPANLLIPKPDLHGAQKLADPNAVYQKKYQFSQDFFSHNLGVWKKHLMPYAGKPGLQYLEIGLYEGRSVFWMLEQILTHPSSQVTGIDAWFDPAVEKQFKENLKQSGFDKRVIVLKGLSADKLLELKPNVYDIVYIDGSHAAEDVLLDAILSWRTLKVGGLFILDDYQLRTYESHENRPMIAVDAFITAHRNSIELVHFGYQVILKKRPQPPCRYKQLCSRIGGLVYNWKKRQLVDIQANKRVKISQDEANTLEEILRSRRIGAFAEQFVYEDLACARSMPHFAKLKKLLHLNL